MFSRNPLGRKRRNRRRKKMSEFDVIVVGGGVNGLTCAAYLAKSGAKVLVLERRDEVGTHCSTEEVTIPGFRHNLHAVWIITATSPCVEDLELEKFGLEFAVTEYAYGMPFPDGKCTLLHTWDPSKTYANWAKFSKKDADTFVQFAADLAPHAMEMIENMAYKQISPQSIDKMLEILQKCKAVPPDFIEMNGFEILDLVFESEHIKTMLASLQWIGALCPWHRTIGSLGALMVMSLGPVWAATQLKGGSHMLPHALARCLIHHGGMILQSCEVEKIIVENGEAKGVILSKDASYPEKKIMAKRAVVSDLTAVPTFLQLVGEEHLEPFTARITKFFRYDEHIIFGAHYALDKAPKWKASSWEPGLQNAFMGYFGPDNMKDVEEFASSYSSGRLHEKIMVNFFVPTLADPSQAPNGKHTALAWLDAPYNLRRLGGPEKWDEIKEDLVAKIAEQWNGYAPNFKPSVLATYAHTPLDIFRRNPSAIKGNWCGGSVCPEQLFTRPPMLDAQGRIVFAPRTPIKKLYISNSMWPWGTTFLGAGYLAASTVAEDLGIRNQPWWNHKPLNWWLKNIRRVAKGARKW